MKFHTTSDNLALQAQAIAGALGDNRNVPATSHILVIAKEGMISLFATDLEVELRTSFPALIEVEGRIAVPGKKFIEIVKDMDNEEVVVEVAANNTMSLFYNRFRSTISCLPASDFPQLKAPAFDSFANLNGAALAQMLRQVTPSICTDETKFSLCGANITVDGGIMKVASTNGHRLTVAERDLSVPDGIFRSAVTIPRKGVSEIRKLAESAPDKSLRFGINDNTAFLAAGDVGLAIRLVNDNFPEYSRVIPGSEGRKIVVPREQLLRSLKRVAILSEAKTKRVKFLFSHGKIVVETNTAGVGESVAELMVDYADEPREMYLNGKYVQEALESLDKEEKIHISLHGIGQPITVKSIENRGYLAVIMPMRGDA